MTDHVSHDDMRRTRERHLAECFLRDKVAAEGLNDIPAFAMPALIDKVLASPVMGPLIRAEVVRQFNAEVELGAISDEELAEVLGL